MLPLRKGSILVVDMCRAAVAAGQTKPDEVLKLVKRGVSAYSVANLHSKVVVTGREVFIGSANASRHSAKTLLEAVVRTSDAATVRDARAYVGSLTGEALTPEHLRQMQKHYRPPRVTGHRVGPTRRTGPLPAHSAVWAVPLVLEDWDDDANRHHQKGVPKAKARIKAKRRYSVEGLHWHGVQFLRRLKPDHLLVQVTEEADGRVLVSPAARVLHLEPYTKKSRQHAIVFVESARGVRRRSVADVVRRLGRSARVLKNLDDPKSLKDPKFVHDLLHLWHKSIGK
jgi:hypothetical protein